MKNRINQKSAFMRRFTAAVLLMLWITAASLAGSEPLSPAEPRTDDVQAEEETDVYTLLIVDQFGDPVPGVFVNFCTDTFCALTQTDENGLIRYQGEPMVYHLTVLNVPEGYDFTPPEELVTEDHPCAMTLVFTKETLTE